MAFRFRIIAQYSVNTKFDDALKILVACEKMARPTELSAAKMHVSISACFFFEDIYISLIGDIFLVPSITLVLASNSRDHDSILKAEWPKNFSSRNTSF